MNEYSGQNTILKAALAFILSIFGTWAEAAAFFATIYTIFLILEWIFRKYLAIRAWRKNRALEAPDEAA